jgi:hypothetical protein
MGSLSAVRPIRALLLILAGVVALLAAGAVGAIAANGFSDVSDDSVHASGIGWMVDAGVTAGCGGDRFCPADGVTRAQMGTFMYRLSGNAPGITPSVTAADTAAVGGVDATTILARLDALEAELADATAQLDAYETLLAGVTRQDVAGRDTLRLSGMNVQVVNGTGTTAGDPNALGNLIIGYDTVRNVDSDKSGSHYLVVGDDHNYTRYGGIVAGIQNTASGDWASVSGGAFSTASGALSSVSGGNSNTASGEGSSVSGGSLNAASGRDASVSGGQSNTASGELSSILGGNSQTVSTIFGIYPQ